MNFPERLQSVIDEQQISRYKIAKTIEISAGTLANYIKGKTSPDSAKLTLLADMLGVSKRWLLDGDGEKYAVEERRCSYGTDAEDQQVVAELTRVVRKLTESVLAKDKQISDLIDILKKYQ